jgi:hypothetical protein
MRVMIRPSKIPTLTVDVTNSIVSARARELSRVQESDLEDSWREAEALLQELCTRCVAGPCDPNARETLPREDRFQTDPEGWGVKGRTPMLL